MAGLRIRGGGAMARPRDGDATDAQGRFMVAVSSGRLGGVLMAAKSPARWGGLAIARRLWRYSRGGKARGWLGIWRVVSQAARL